MSFGSLVSLLMSTRRRRPYARLHGPRPRRRGRRLNAKSTPRRSRAFKQIRKRPLTVRAHGPERIALVPACGAAIYSKSKQLKALLLGFRFIVAAAIVAASCAHAQEKPYSFNVLNHRSVALTAQYWNPILVYVTEKTGIPLELKLNKTSQENTSKA